MKTKTRMRMKRRTIEGVNGEFNFSFELVDFIEFNFIKTIIFLCVSFPPY
jgi:hypothetical protein